MYIPKQYNPPDRQINKYILYKVNDDNMNEQMKATINSGNITEILKFFIINTKQSYNDKENNTPIHLILKLNSLTEEQKCTLIEQLIKDPYNLSFDSFNNNYETPLHYAIKNRYIRIVELLLDSGADATKINNKHQNALHIALIPNIGPCENEIKPDPIIPVEKIDEDKNDLYNEVLSIFYNEIKNNEDIQKSLNIFKNNIKKYHDFYKHYKDSNIILFNNEIRIKNTPIDTILNNLNQFITENILKPNNNYTYNKKIINDQIKKSIKDITSEYNNFSKFAISKINLNNENYDLKPILFYNYPSLDEYIAILKNDVLDKIYDDIDNILKILHKDYKLKKPKTGIIRPIRIINREPDNIQRTVNQNLIHYFRFNKNNLQFDNYITRLNIKSRIINNTILVERNEMRNIFNRLNILDITNCTEKTLKIFIIIYGSKLYSDDKINIRKKQIIEYYNILTGKENENIIYDGIHPALDFTTLFPGEDQQTIIDLDRNDQFELNAINEINKIIVNHIKNLNLWLALDNLQIIPVIIEIQTLKNFILNLIKDIEKIPDDVKLLLELDNSDNNKDLIDGILPKIHKINDTINIESKKKKKKKKN